MTETVMQCCYTNAVQEIGGKISSGWQAVAVSENVPPDAYTSCVNLQNANSTIQGHMVDERGNVLNLFEITGDGTYVYVIRTQYGLLDRLGRPNMFSHAYIFPWKREDVIADPNLFLTLEKGNFANNEETARQPRTQLNRTQPFTLARALMVAGIEAEAYLTLIQCVYSQYSERKASKPIYIQYDGTEEQMQALLYCIYYGIPYCMRRTLSIASTVANAFESKNLIFSEFAAKHDAYIVPQTGENNILTSRTERKIARYGFVDYAARHYAEIDVNAYFFQLEKLATELGDSTASNDLILKIAHQLIVEPELSQLGENELDSRLSDALRSKSYGSQRMDSCISDMLEEVCRRRMLLTEENEANLNDRLATSATAQLADSGEQYHIYRLSTLGAEDAARMLAPMASPVFDRYSRTLATDGKGIQILDYFYSQYALANREITWEALDALLEEISYLPSAPKTKDLIGAKAWELYDSLLGLEGQAIPAYNALMDLMEKLYGEGCLSGYSRAAKEAYWTRKTLTDFSYSNFDEYKAMSVDVKMYKLFSAFYHVMDQYQMKGDDSFLKALNSFFISKRSVLAELGLTSTAASKAKSEARMISPETAYLSNWIKLAALVDTEPLFAVILNLRGDLQRRDFDTFTSTYQDILQGRHSARNTGSLIRDLGKTLVGECHKIDTLENWVPLDVWLVLGTPLYPNVFRIFDVDPPNVLGVEEPYVVSHSKLLRERPYLEQAEDYIQEKGAEAKTVRRWLNELKNLDKRRRADERKARNDAGGSSSFLDRIVSISPFAAKEETRPGKPAPDSSPRTPPGSSQREISAKHEDVTQAPDKDYSHGETLLDDFTTTQPARGKDSAKTSLVGHGDPTRSAPSGNSRKPEDKPTEKKGFFGFWGRK